LECLHGVYYSDTDNGVYGLTLKEVYKYWFDNVLKK
jgi:hypothetical protein